MSTSNYTTTPQSSVNGIAARIVLENSDGPIAAGNGLPTTDAGAVDRASAKRGIAGAPLISADASADPVAVTEGVTAGKTQVIDDIVFSVDTDMRVIFTDNDGVQVFYLYATANTSQQITPRAKVALSPDGPLFVQTSVPGNISVTAFYHEE